MKVGLNLALRLVPKYNKIALCLFFFFKFWLLQSVLYIAIHSFLGGWQEVNHFFLKASRVILVVLQLLHALVQKMEVCVCRKGLRVCAHLCQRRRYTETRASRQKGSPRVGRGRRRVCTEKALERTRTPRESALSCTLPVVPVDRQKPR